MFSKKSLPITIAFILMLALGTMGLTYGYWTDQLTINGTVNDGKLRPEFLRLWWSDTNCTYTLDSTNHA